MFSKNALRRLSADITPDDLEDIANLAYHIEHSEDTELFKRFAEILDMYCLDHMTIMNIRDVIEEAVENARSSSSDESNRDKLQ